VSADVCQVRRRILPGRRRCACGRAAFSHRQGFPPPDHRALPAIHRRQRYRIAGIEFIADAAGEIYTYDVNTNTNYNGAAEAEAGMYGMRAIARHSAKSWAGLRLRSSAVSRWPDRSDNRLLEAFAAALAFEQHDIALDQPQHVAGQVDELEAGALGFLPLLSVC